MIVSHQNGPTPRANPRVCVIGAGPCGLTTVKNLRAAGLTDIVCYDENDAIGGNWVFREDPAVTSVYESTHIISSRKRSGFFDYLIPEHYPDFPSHRQILFFLESYAKHFGVLPFVRLKTRVQRAELRADGRWLVRISGPEGTGDEVFDYLMVCSGHHRDPYVPESEGRFIGNVMHSRDYKRADERFFGKRVLVIGGGNSACDIVVEVSRVAERACISMRRPYYILPKVIFGRPVDALYRRARKFIPKPLLQFLIRRALQLAIGPWEDYGLQRPRGGPMETHPTLNSNILNALRHGTVVPRVGVDRFEGSLVHFQDGSAESFDTIVWATGFRISFPFLDHTIVDWDINQPPPLYLKMMHPRVASLFFIGLFQPIGCIWRLADHQARIAALQIIGLLDRPANIAMRIEHARRSPHWHFDTTPRHALEVDYRDFRRELAAELARARAPLAA